MNHWLLACAIGNLAFMAFHLAFWRLFGWRQDLAKLHWTNRAIMQVLNLRLTYVFGLFAFMQIVFADEMLGTPLGRALQGGIALFWAMRAAEQIVFFRLRHPLSVLMLGIFLGLAAVHGSVLLEKHV